jgi:hypothetical protein
MPENMVLLDWFAGLVMQGVFSTGKLEKPQTDERYQEQRASIAKLSYDMAEAMMEERTKRKYAGHW